MAECSYARCLQERRHIKRELLKWSKDMIHIVGLERVAEELMGRRKWKQYQEALTRSYTNADHITINIDSLENSNQKQESGQKLTKFKEETKLSPLTSFDENHHQAKQTSPLLQQQQQQHKIKESNDEPKVKTEFPGTDEKTSAVHIKKENYDDSTATGDTTINKYSCSNNNNNTNNNNNNKNNHSLASHKNSQSRISGNGCTLEQQQPIHITTTAATTAAAALKVSKPTSSTSAYVVPLTATDAATTTETQTSLTSAVTDISSNQEPVDWKPNEKCYFCVDGKLLTVNAKGELVAESSPALSEADPAHRDTIIDSESDSSDSCPPESATSSQRVNVNKILTSRLRDSNMTSMESMAARLAAIHSIQGQLYPNLWYSQLAQQTNSATPTTSETSAAAISPSPKGSPSPCDATGEQPLDLSSKPSPNSSLGGDLKHSFRVKPRITAVAGRRTYSEEELQSALQDIISGKLGTRRAAVQYNIPRSTLRNKVYKLSLDAKRDRRESALLHLQHDLDIDMADNVDGDVDDGEEDSSGEKCYNSGPLSHPFSQQQQQLQHQQQQQQPQQQPPLHLHQSQQQQQQPGIDDLATQIATTASIAAKIQKLCETGAGCEDVVGGTETTAIAAAINTEASPKATTSQDSHTKRKTSTPAMQMSTGNDSAAQDSPQLQSMYIDPFAVLQSLLLTGRLGQSAQPEETLPVRDLFIYLLMSTGYSFKDAVAAISGETPMSRLGEAFNNGKPNMIDPRLLLQQFPLLQHQLNSQQPHQSHHQHQQLGGGHSFETRLPKSETSPVDLNEVSEDPSVILKIPSYKPVAGSTSSAGGTPSSTAGPAPSASPSTQSGCSNKNGESHYPQNSTSPRMPASMLTASVTAGNNSIQQHPPSASHHHHNNIPGMSPPLIRHHGSAVSGDSQSPPTLSLRDVIANSIHRTMNQQANKDAQAAAVAAAAAAVAAESDRNEQYKKPSISVIKNIGGTDTTRFGAAPNVLHNSHHSGHSIHSSSVSSSHGHMHHSHHSQNAVNNSLAGGKGTRPKRGKYRNYDRDSLVEAVKAVQRGEMSVHRAGSYYGVPHSTLEYKVKERHLMRPRKREPKPQPLDDRPGSSGVNNLSAGLASSAKGNTSIPGLSSANNLDKLKSSSTSSMSTVSGTSGVIAGVPGNSSTSNQKQSTAATHKNNNSNPPTAFPNTSPNGMKMPIFDPAVAAAQLQYAPHLFWSHPAAAAAAAASSFGQLQMDFSRTTPGASTTVGGGSSGSSAASYANAEAFLKSQMIQRFHEESLRASGSSAGLNTASNPSPIASPLPPNHLPGKNARDIAENLYETGGANGSSLLDGIIRKTLDRKSADITTHGALLDQLLINNRPPYNHHNSSTSSDQQLLGTSSATTASTAHKIKRNASPLLYPTVDIKRERSSPAHSDEGSSSDGEDDSENNNGGASSSSHRRSRNMSRDSDTDGSAKNSSDHLHPSHHQHQHLQQHLHQQLQQHQQQQQHHLQQQHQHHHQHLQQQHSVINSTLPLREDLNGGTSLSTGGSCAHNLEVTTAAAAATSLTNLSSILHEKLGQIKAEHDDSL